MPVVLVVGYWYPQVYSVGGSIVSFLGVCGLTYLMAQVARHSGRALEVRLGEQVGRLLSARLLTFGNSIISAETKKRYHAFLRSNGIKMSSPEAERSDPQLAFSRARSAVDWLLLYTLPSAKRSLLFNDNVAYGFTRNLRGLKFFGVTIATLSIIANTALVVVNLSNTNALRYGILIEIVLVIMLLTWIFLVTETLVCQSSLAYAQRLFSQCEMATAGSHAGEHAPKGR